MDVAENFPPEKNKVFWFVGVLGFFVGLFVFLL